MAVWTWALNRKGVEGVQAEGERGEPRVRLTVWPQSPAAVCPHGGGVSGEVHQTRDLDGVRDWPLADRAVEWCVRVPQFWCAACGRAFTPCNTFGGVLFIAILVVLLLQQTGRHPAPPQPAAVPPEKMQDLSHRMSALTAELARIKENRASQMAVVDRTAFPKFGGRFGIRRA